MEIKFADPRTVVRAVDESLRPPRKLTLSEWADANYYLSAESSADAGKWHTLPYQREIMDAITDQTVEQVAVMKSARVGYTKCINAAIGYYIHQAPCPIMVVQPNDEDAEGYSKEEIAPMLRDCPVLASIIFEETKEVGVRGSGNTILHKHFPGGVLAMVGSKSAAGFRRVSRKVVIFDEVDGYEASAGKDGDQIKLGRKRSEKYWDRKIVLGSTPLIAGSSRIEALFLDGDQRYFYVPCPHCGHMARLVFSGDKGHVMTWPEGRPEEAFFTCQANGCVIEEKHKPEMVKCGEWRPSTEPKLNPNGRARVSFHIWTAYSTGPNTAWADIAKEFVEATAKGTEDLKTFINTTLGETWKERGDAPDWERLYNRREPYKTETVPDGVVFITAGVDVQKKHLVYEVVGWGPSKESWSLDAGILPIDIENEEDWAKLDAFLERTYLRPDGTPQGIFKLAIDSGAFTQSVYGWARRHPMTRVMATKGVHTAKLLLNTPSKVDVTHKGRKVGHYQIWPMGSDVGKTFVYGALGAKRLDESQPYPPNYCHFPDSYDAEFFKQLTAEHLVSIKNKRTGFTIHEWQLIPGRQNHHLDTRVMAYAAAVLAGVDRLPPKVPIPKPEPPKVAPVMVAPIPGASEAPPKPKRQVSGFWGKRGKGWLR